LHLLTAIDLHFPYIIMLVPTQFSIKTGDDIFNYSAFKVIVSFS